MPEFEYHRPATLDDALRLLASGGLKPLAGGTDLIAQWRRQVVDGSPPPVLAGVVDLKKIPELSATTFSDTAGASIGAALPVADLAALPWLAAHYQGLHDAAVLIGGWQIQNRASLGGNLCNASPSADGVPPLLVLDAVCKTGGVGGIAAIPLAEFCTAPGRTRLPPGALLATIELPPPAPRSASAYLRFTPRAEMDIAVAGVAVWLRLEADGQTVAQARIALGAVGPTAIRADTAEKILAGSAGGSAFAAAAKAASEAARPIDDLRASADFRRHLVGVLASRALQIAYSRAGEQA